MYVCVSIKFLNLPRMFFLLTEHNVVATSLLPNWVMVASHFFSSVMLTVSAVWISCRREGTNSLFKKSQCKSQRPFSGSQCPAFALLLLTVLLQERKRQEEGSCEPLERKKVWELRRSQSPNSTHQLTYWMTSGNPRGPWASSLQPGSNSHHLTELLQVVVNTNDCNKCKAVLWRLMNSSIKAVQ